MPSLRIPSSIVRRITGGPPNTVRVANEAKIKQALTAVLPGGALPPGADLSRIGSASAADLKRLTSALQKLDAQGPNPYAQAILRDEWLISKPSAKGLALRIEVAVE